MQEFHLERCKYTGGELLRFVVAYTGAQLSEWDQRASFLRHLRRFGVPNAEGIRRGPGAQYRYADLFQLAVASEMAESGMTVAAAARIVTRGWNTGLSEVPQRVRAALAAHHRQALLLVVSRTGFDGFELSPTIQAWSFMDAAVTFDGSATHVEIMWAPDFFGSDFFAVDLRQPSPFAQQRRIVVNLSRVVQAVDGLAANVEALNALPAPDEGTNAAGRSRR
jgi:hypothetical protein